MDIQEKIEKLRTSIRYHNQKYHVEERPEISDREYDRLFDELLSLEREYPEYVTADSPTQRLALEIQTDFDQATHYAPLLSLSNTYSPEDLRDFDLRTKRALNLSEEASLEYCVELKYDGLSVALVYQKGMLTRAATRGNGLVGENITHNMKTIPSIPLSIQSEYEVIEIRGEVLMSKKAFARLNEMRADDGLALFANPRNAASGSVRQLDPKVTAERRLEVFVYDIIYHSSESTFHDHVDELLWMKERGLKITEPTICPSIEEVIKYTLEMESTRNTFPFEIDGLVVKVRDLSYRDRLGATEHHPRSAIAYKFPAQEEVTTIDSIEVQVGRTGVLTPVAHLAPIHIAGVMVSRASLHNMDELQKKDIRIGDHVLIKRAGDVIPHVVSSIPEKRTGKERVFSMPEECPACHSKVVRLQDEVAYRCVNAACPAQLTLRLIYFVSKEAMDIDGFGKKYVEKLVEHGLLQSIADIFRLQGHKEKLAAVLYAGGTLEKLYNKHEGQSSLFEEEEHAKKDLKLLYNVLHAIEDAKQRGLVPLITGLGIRYVGKKTAKILVEHIDHIKDLYDVGVEELIGMDGVGPIVAESIVDFFSAEENRMLLTQLEELGVCVAKKERNDLQSHELEGKTFLFTGSLELFSRDDATKLVESRGGRVLSSVSKNLSYLVVGTKAGSKLRKAEDLGIQVLTEEDFKVMVNF